MFYIIAEKPQFMLIGGEYSTDFCYTGRRRRWSSRATAASPSATSSTALWACEDIDAGRGGPAQLTVWALQRGFLMFASAEQVCGPSVEKGLPFATRFLPAKVTFRADVAAPPLFPVKRRPFPAGLIQT